MGHHIMIKTSVGWQKEKVSRMDVVRSVYGEIDKVKNIFQETVGVTNYDIYTLYSFEVFYDITITADGQLLATTSSSNYYASMDVPRLTREHEFVMDDKTYVVISRLYSRVISITSTAEEWNSLSTNGENLV